MAEGSDQPGNKVPKLQEPAQELNYKYGSLNPIYRPDVAPSLIADGGADGINMIKSAISNIYSTDSRTGTGPYKGIVLRRNVYEEGSGAGTGWELLLGFFGLKKPLLNYSVFIPEIHSHLPTPSKTFKDQKENSDDPQQRIIDMYPEFVAETTAIPEAEPGDIVWVDFGNNLTFEDPIYIGPIDSPVQNGAGGAGGGALGAGAFGACGGNLQFSGVPANGETWQKAIASYESQKELILGPLAGKAPELAEACVGKGIYIRSYFHKDASGTSMQGDPARIVAELKDLGCDWVRLPVYHQWIGTKKEGGKVVGGKEVKYGIKELSNDPKASVSLKAISDACKNAGIEVWLWGWPEPWGTRPRAWAKVMTQAANIAKPKGICINAEAARSYGKEFPRSWTGQVGQNAAGTIMKILKEESPPGTLISFSSYGLANNAPGQPWKIFADGGKTIGSPQIYNAKNLPPNRSSGKLDYPAKAIASWLDRGFKYIVPDGNGGMSPGVYMQDITARTLAVPNVRGIGFWGHSNCSQSKNKRAAMKSMQIPASKTNSSLVEKAKENATTKVVAGAEKAVELLELLKQAGPDLENIRRSTKEKDAEATWTLISDPSKYDSQKFTVLKKAVQLSPICCPQDVDLKKSIAGDFKGSSGNFYITPFAKSKFSRISKARTQANPGGTQVPSGTNTPGGSFSAGCGGSSGFNAGSGGGVNVALADPDFGKNSGSMGLSPNHPLLSKNPATLPDDINVEPGSKYKVWASGGSPPGSSTFNRFREDVAEDFASIKKVINELGGIVPSSGTSRLSGGGFHPINMAIDLHTSPSHLSTSHWAKGYPIEEKPIWFYVTSEGPNNENMRLQLRIWCRSTRARGTNTTYNGKTYSVVEKTLDAIVCHNADHGGGWDKPPTTMKITGNFIDLTKVFSDFGFGPIGAPKNYRKICALSDDKRKTIPGYNKDHWVSEWWHFQSYKNLTKDVLYRDFFFKQKAGGQVGPHDSDKNPENPNARWPLRSGVPTGWRRS
jgi:hypothetical protein